MKVSDCRGAKTLAEAAQNADGTWNGAKALSWLSEALSPGQRIPEAEVTQMFEDTIERKRRAGHLGA